MSHKLVKEGYFVTYVSTTWNKTVASAYMQNEGMMIEIGSGYKNDHDVYACDVSWISKFEDECEILFSRFAQDGELYDGTKGFICKVIDQSNGIQTVRLDDYIHESEDEMS